MGQVGQGSLIVALLQQLTAQAHRFLCCLHSAADPGGLTIDGDGGNGGEPGIASVEGGYGFALGLQIEEGHLQLFYGVPFFVSDER